MPDSHVGLAAVERLRRLAPRLAAGDDDERWLAAAVGRYLEEARSGLSLDTAAGVACAAGTAPWWRAAGLAERDRLIRELGGTLPGSVNARAVERNRRLTATLRVG